MCFKSHLKLRNISLAALGMLLLAPAAGCGIAAQGHNVQGTRLYEQGNYQAALQNFQQSIANDPRNADSYYNMAATLHRIAKANGDANTYQQAENYYNQCLEYNDNHTDCYRSLAVLLAETGRTDASLRLLQGWNVRSPNNPNARIELARVMDELGNREVAQQKLLEALSSDPSNARALTALAKMREDEGNPVQAMQIYERSLGINRFQPQVASRLATLQSSLGYVGAPQISTGTQLVNQPTQWNRY